MHGIIFQQLQQFVTKKHGIQTWFALLESAELSGKIYLPTQVYPDSDIASIVKSASAATRVSPANILLEFGEFMVPTLLKVYAGSIQPHWTTIDLLANVESTIHKAVRFADKKATPPELVCTRLSTSHVVIEYNSKRKMIEVGVGIIRGLARAKNEKIVIERVDNEDITKLDVVLQ